MNDVLRRRIVRKLESLPDAQIYQVMDYIEFLESRYNRGVADDATALQKLGERLEDGLRKRTMNPSNLREAFQLISTADRVLSSVSSAGRQILDELQLPPDGADVDSDSGSGGSRPGGSQPGSRTGGSQPGSRPGGSRRSRTPGERG